MLNIVDIFALSVIPILLTVILLYVILKTGILEHKISEILSNWLINASEDAEIQKAIYILGALAANGAKSGFGLKASGKMKLTDIVIQALAQKFLNPSNTGESNPAGLEI